MADFSPYYGLELPKSIEKYDVAVANKNNRVIDSELHKLDLKNKSQDELLATKKELNEEITRARTKENELLEKINESKDNNEDLLNHLKDNDNPHNVTKEQLGLENVPNVSTNDQTPTFSQATTRENISSGEKISIILGKIMKFFSDLKIVAFTGSYTDLSNKPTIPTLQSNTKEQEGYVSAGSGYVNKVWKTDAEGNPGWRDEKSECSENINISDIAIEFTESTNRENIASNEKIPTLFGKIKKWLSDLKTVAFTGKADDVTFGNIFYNFGFGGPGIVNGAIDPKYELGDTVDKRFAKIEEALKDTKYYQQKENDASDLISKNYGSEFENLVISVDETDGLPRLLKSNGRKLYLLFWDIKDHFNSAMSMIGKRLPPKYSIDGETTKYLREDGVWAELPIASEETLGVIKPDGETCTVDENGVFSVKNSSTSPEQTIKIVTWADGTDEEIAAMVEAHYNNEINLSDYWAVGDERVIHLEEMGAWKSGTLVSHDGETHDAQDSIFVIIGFDHDDLVTPINEHMKAAVTVHMKEVLKTDGMVDYDYTYYYNKNNRTYTRSWKECHRRVKWINSIFKNAIPEKIRNAIKTVNKVTYATKSTYSGSSWSRSYTKETSQDDCYLLSCKEVGFLTTGNYYKEEGEIYEYYAVESNRIKYKPSYSSSVEYTWWLRSPCVSNIGGWHSCDCSKMHPVYGPEFALGLSIAFSL